MGQNLQNISFCYIVSFLHPKIHFEQNLNGLLIIFGSEPNIHKHGGHNDKKKNCSHFKGFEDNNTFRKQKWEIKRSKQKSVTKNSKVTLKCSNFSTYDIRHVQRWLSRCVNTDLEIELWPVYCVTHWIGHEALCFHQLSKRRSQIKTLLTWKNLVTVLLFDAPPFSVHAHFSF